MVGKTAYKRQRFAAGSLKLQKWKQIEGRRTPQHIGPTLEKARVAVVFIAQAEFGRLAW
jgi:hypothetical protein